jgi:hypothetical protein
MASRVTALISGHLLRGGAFFDQRTGAINDVASAHSVPDDTSEQPPDCFRICRLGDEAPQSGFGAQPTAQIGNADSCSGNATWYADVNSV